MTVKKQKRSTEQPILTWRMPAGQRVAIALVSTAVAALLAMAVLNLCKDLFYGFGLVLGIVVALVVLRPSIRTIAGFDCTGTGLRVTRIDPSKIVQAPWGSILRLKRLAGPLVLLSVRGGWLLFFALPKPVLSQLIGILRETSNARIEGFGENR